MKEMKYIISTAQYNGKRLNGYTVWIIVLCFISNFSYFPVFQRISYSRYTVIALWSLFALYTCFHKSIVLLKNRLLLYITILYSFYILNSFIVLLCGYEGVFSNHFFSPVSVAIIVFFSATQLRDYISKAEINIILKAYAYIMGFIAILLFFFYLRGSDLSSSYYGYSYGKNEIAVMLCCGVIILSIYPNQKNYVISIGKAMLCFFMIADIFILRCRSVMLCLGFLLIILITKSNIDRNFRWIVMIALSLLVVVFIQKPHIFDILLDRVLFAGRDAYNIDELSSGRLTQITRGLKVFYENPLTGIGSRGTLDCFYISVLANYGLLSWPLIILALFPVFWSINNIRKKDTAELCFMLIAVSFLILSIFEELAPFGPGTRCYILWLIWGLLLTQNTTDKDRLYVQSYRYII